MATSNDLGNTGLPILERTESIKLPAHLQERLDADQAKFGKGEVTREQLDQDLKAAGERKQAEDQAKVDKARAMAEGESIAGHRHAASEDVSAEGLVAKQQQLEAQINELKALEAKLAEAEERRLALASQIPPSPNSDLSFVPPTTATNTTSGP